MTLSGRAKIGLAIASLIGILIYLVVLDYGINAGRIHHGVHVRDIDVGGLTIQEAFDVLTVEGAKLHDEPVLLTREFTDCRFEPSEILWDPRPNDTARSAYRVGRGVSWPTALGTRVKAWVAGATIDWNDSFDRDEMRQLLDWCDTRVTAVGYELRRHRLREVILEAIKTWPRMPVTIPILRQT